MDKMKMQHDEIAKIAQDQIANTEKPYSFVVLHDDGSGKADIYVAGTVDDLEHMINGLILYRDARIEELEQRALMN